MELSGGEVRDEKIADGPVVSGSGPAGSGGSFGADGAGRVFGMVGRAGLFAGFGGRGRECVGTTELVGAEVDDIDEDLLARFLADEGSRDLPCVALKRWIGTMRRFLTAAGYLS